MQKALIAFLSLFLTVSKGKAANNYEEALKKTAEALVVKSGLADQLDARLRELTEKYAPNLIRENGALFVFVARGLTENYWQIGHKWEF
jgi:hypothetical protein